jgi:DNA mismatch repair protein MutL
VFCIPLLMSKIRVLSDQLANQIAAGEVVERPASVAKELVENSIDAGARRIEIDVEAGGRRLLRVVDDGEGMSRDDAVLAFERHATSKITAAKDLDAISTLGFRGEALASIASVARVELVSKTEEALTATRILIEGGRWREVKDAAYPQGTSISVRDLFFNVPARRKFLRSEATESFHLVNLVTHYALAHPEIAFTLTNNGRETLRVAPAKNVRERAYQIFGADFIENLLEVSGGQPQVARVTGFVSAPRERRSSRDAQYLFINGRSVHDRLVGSALSEAYKGILPHGNYPAALLFLEVPLEEVDVNVHPAKTEVRFRRAAAVKDAVREAVRAALASAGYVRSSEAAAENDWREVETEQEEASYNAHVPSHEDEAVANFNSSAVAHDAAEESPARTTVTGELVPPARQEKMEFGFTVARDEFASPKQGRGNTARDLNAILRRAYVEAHEEKADVKSHAFRETPTPPSPVQSEAQTKPALPPLVSASSLAREVPVETLSNNIRPLGQLEESYIIATDEEGLLLIDQHAAHERILFDRYHALEGARRAESQHLLMPETFDLTPAEAIAFDRAAEDLEAYGFELMRLSGRTVAIKAVPADLPADEARNVLGEVLSTMDAERRVAGQDKLRDKIASALASRAAIKSNTQLSMEKMRWLIDSLLMTSAPTTGAHGRPIVMRLMTRDIKKGFQRT